MSQTTARLTPIDFTDLPAPLAYSLKRYKRGEGTFSNFIKTLANAPAILETYLAFSDAIERSKLPVELREKIALAVSELTSSEYDVAAHTQQAKELGLDSDEILLCRKASTKAPRDQAILRFAQTLIRKHGNLTDAELEEARQYSDDDQLLIEAVATVACVHFSNLINNLSRTQLDTPPVQEIVHEESDQ